MRIAFAILILACVRANAQSNELVFEDKAEGLTLRLPAGWVEFPKDSLHQVAGFGAKLEPTPPPRELLAAFQRAPDVQHPTFPRIVVHAQKTEPINEKRFRNLHAAPLVEITVAGSLGFPGRPTFMRSARYDPDRLCLNFEFDCYLEDYGFIRAAGRSFLTRDGLVNIYGYAPGAGFDEFMGEFNRVISTVELTPEHRYVPGSVTPISDSAQDTWKTLRQLGMVVLVMVLAAAVWIFVWRMRDRVWSDDI